MSQLSPFWQNVYLVVMLVAWAGSVIFPFLYGLLRPWWKSEMGTHLFFYSAVVGLALTLAVLRPVFGDFPGRGIVSFAILLALTGVIWWRVALFFRTDNRHEE